MFYSVQLFIQLCTLWPRRTNVKDLTKTRKTLNHHEYLHPETFIRRAQHLFHEVFKSFLFLSHTLHLFLFSLHRCYLQSDNIDLNSSSKAASVQFDEVSDSLSILPLLYTCSYVDIKREQFDIFNFSPFLLRVPGTICKKCKITV